jgi:hypothetical protein
MSIDADIPLLQNHVKALEKELALAKSHPRISSKGREMLSKCIEAARRTLDSLQKERDRRIEDPFHKGLDQAINVHRAQPPLKKRTP